MAEVSQRACKATWVCFDCREVMRRPALYPDVVPCPRCRQPGRRLGTRLRVPPKADLRAWQAFRRWICESHLAEITRRERLRVADRHRLERRLTDLETRPSAPQREQEIQRLRARLTKVL